MLIGTVRLAAANPALMPLPAKITFGDGALKIDQSFSIVTRGYSDRRLNTAITRMTARLSRQTGIPFGIAPPRPVLSIACTQGGAAYPALGETESYRLDVSAGKATLTSDTVTGALRGLATFAQLVESGPDGFFVPAVTIADQPRFPWRGLMLDVSRHWMPLPVVERNLDAMEAVKLNVFHWHLSDDQGFRVESKRFPKLQQDGSDGHFYTQAEVRHVIDYARDRGIRVIPEFDMPGHTTAWFVGYPELASAPGPYQIERNWGIFQPTMDPSREATYAFLDALIGEMSALFPDPYFHIGGDEVEPTQWNSSASIQRFATGHGFRSPDDLQAYFTRRVQALVQKHGKTMIGWDEILNGEIGDRAVIQSWRGQESLAKAARKGHRGLLSFGYYLDHLRPASFHYANDPLSGDAANLSPAESARILGGEACMWSEYVTPETVDSRIWPRLAAIAERLWSPQTVQDVAGMYDRMEPVGKSLTWTGVLHRSNYQEMLDRLASLSDPGPVRTLADVVEALGQDDRYKSRHYDSLVPLNRLADAARPESELVRHLESLARAARNDADSRKRLQAAFYEWQNCRLAFNSLPANGFVSEMTPLLQALSDTATTGLDTLARIESGNGTVENWISERKQALDRLEAPSAEVRLAAVRPVRILLELLAHQEAGRSSAVERNPHRK